MSIWDTAFLVNCILYMHRLIVKNCSCQRKGHHIYVLDWVQYEKIIICIYICIYCKYYNRLIWERVLSIICMKFRDYSVASSPYYNNNNFDCILTKSDLTGFPNYHRLKFCALSFKNRNNNLIEWYMYILINYNAFIDMERNFIP